MSPRGVDRVASMVSVCPSALSVRRSVSSSEKSPRGVLTALRALGDEGGAVPARAGRLLAPRSRIGALLAVEAVGHGPAAAVGLLLDDQHRPRLDDDQRPGAATEPGSSPPASAALPSPASAAESPAPAPEIGELAGVRIEAPGTREVGALGPDRRRERGHREQSERNERKTQSRHRWSPLEVHRSPAHVFLRFRIGRRRTARIVRSAACTGRDPEDSRFIPASVFSP